MFNLINWKNLNLINWKNLNIALSLLLVVVLVVSQANKTNLFATETITITLSDEMESGEGYTVDETTKMVSSICLYQPATVKDLKGSFSCLP